MRFKLRSAAATQQTSRTGQVASAAFSFALLAAGLFGSTAVLAPAFAQQPTAASAGKPDQLTLLDGSTLSAEVQGIDAQGEVKVSGQEEPLPLVALRKIVRGQPVPPSQPLNAASPAIVELAGGGRIIAGKLSIEDETCQVGWDYGDKLELSIDALRAIRFHPDKSEPDFDKALAGESEELDRIFLRVEEKLEVVRGLIESLSDKEITFEFQGETSKLPREKLFGVIVAAIGESTPEEGACLVQLAGGKSPWGETLGEVALWGKVLSLSDGELRLEVDGETIPLPWRSVQSLAVRSDRLTFLSDLKPAEAVHEPIVAPRRPWTADRTVAGHTLTLRKRTFDKGLGMAPYSRLVYELDGRQETFSAWIGIDDETAGQGDAEFVVVGDGRELFRLRATGRDTPHQLRLDVSGVRRLELIVEPGAQLDLADHADWGDACLIRTEK